MTQGRSYVRVVVVLLGLLYSICLTEAQYNPPNGIYSFPLALTIRDQRNGPIGGSDFNNLGQTSPYIPSVPAYGVITGLVLPQLGADGTPTLNPNRTPGYISILTTKNDTFSQWYHDVTWDGAPVMKFIYYITMTWNSASGVYSYNNQAFFPLDGLGWGNQGLADGNGVLHNFGFTVMFSTQFTYTGSGTLSYTGDDSVWVFINNKLEVDIGGIHSASSNSVDLTTLGLTVGQTYPLDFFFAEEHTTASTILIETTFPFTSVSAMSNITLNSTSVAACCSFFANTPLDNTHPSVKNTTYALTSTASVRVTFLCSTVTTVGYSFGLVDPAQTVAFPDIRSHANGGILYAGNTWTSSPYASGSVLTLWIQTPTTTYYSMLNGTNMFAQIYYPSVGTVVGIRLANTVGRPYDDLVVRIEVLGTWQNSSVPTYTPETCTSFTPPQNLTFEASCVDYAPDDCGCSITPTLPNGWDIAQLDSGTMAVFQNYGSRWRSTCFGVMSQGVLVGYSTAGSCTLPTPPSVYRTISPQGQVCLSTCSFPYLLRTTSVDTTCNLNIYGKNCATNSVSTAYINPLLPNGVAVSLVGTTPTPVLTLPTLPIPNTIAIQFVQDLSIATGTQNVYAQSVINTLCSQLGASYLWVSCSYAYYASTLTMNYGFVSSNSFTAATVPPQYTNINTNTPAASTSGMSTYQVLNTIANDPNVGFQSGNVQNIIVFLSMSPVGSAGTYLTAALNSTLILAGITPVFVSPYDYTGIIPFLPYAVSYKTGSLTWTGVTATLSAPVLASITSVINRVYIGLRAQDDPWNIVSFPNTIGQPSNVAFQDNSVSGDYTVVTSKAGTNNPEYYINVAVCRKLGPLISVPINTLFTSPLPNSILTTDLVLTNSAENCSCSLTPLPTVAAYIASDPLTSRYSTFPNYPGPVLYVFGRGQYNIYVSTYTTPVPSFTTPSSYIQVVALSNWTSPVLYNGPGPWLGSQYALTVKVVGLEWTTFYSSSSTYSPTDSGMSILGSYSAYLSLFLTDQGATIANCSTPPPTAAFKLKSAFGMLGKLIIRYRLCDNCSCSNTAVLPVLFYRATDLPPVGSNLTVSVNASKSISINIIVSDPDDLKTNLAISFNPSTFPSSSIGKLVDINGNTIPTNTNTGLTVSSTSYQNVTFSAGPYPQTVVIQYYVTDPLGLSNTYYITVIILPLFSVPKITVCPTPILTPRVVLVSSTIEIDFNPGQVVSLVLRPPTPTAPIGILYYNVSSLSYIISNPITVDTTLSSVTLDSSGSIVYTVYFEASPFFPNTQVLTSLWYASTPTGVNSGTTSTATNTLTIRVTPNNLPNNINAIAQKNFTQNTPVKIIFTGTDPDSYDNANLTLAFPVLPTFGVLSGLNNMSIVAGAWCLVADRVTSAIGTSYAITYTPFTGYYGTDSFTWAFFDIAAVMNYSDRASETADQVTFQMTIIQTQKGVTCSNQAFNVLPITRPNPTSVAIVYLPMKLTFQVLPVGTTPVINMTIAGCSITKNNYLSTTVNGVNTNLTTFPITFSSSGPWTFTYTQNALMTTGQDTCSYYTTGAFGYRSTDNGGSNCTFNIIQRPFTPPVATGATFYLKEGENITINMGNSNYFYDANGDWLVAVNVNQTLNTTTVGSLVSATSTSLTFPYSVPTTDGVTFSLIFSSVSIIVGTCCNKTTQFSFTFTDSTGQVSNTAIMTFVVTPVDHAPTLSINGSTTGFSVTRARNSSAVLAITISDVDSDWGILQLPRNQFPWGSGAGSVVTITDSLSPFTTTVITQTSTVLVSNVSFLVSRSRLFYLTWTPAITNPDGLSSLSFTAQAQDAEGLQSSEIPIPLSITLNNNPVANPCSVVNVLENGAVTFTVSGTDPDPWHNLVLDFSLTVTPTKGTIAINTTTGTTALGTTWIPVTQIPNLSTSMTIRSLVYTPNYLYSGNDTCSFQFRDLLGAVSNVQILVIQVAHVNHPPTSNSLYITTTLNTPVPFSLTAADIDGNALTFLIKSNISVFTGNHGTMMLTSTSNVLTTATNISAGAGNTLNFIYTPPYGLQVSDNPYFTFNVYDGTVASGPYIVQVTVTKPLVYDPPTCENFTVTTNQETALGIVLDNYVKGYDGIPFTVKVISVPANGNLTSNGALVTVGMTIVANTGSPIYSTTYTPPYMFWGVDYFEFEATDIYGLASIPGICTINVIHVDKPPVLVVGVTSVNVSRNTNAIIPITVYDVDSATIIVSISSGSVPTPSTLTINTTSPVPTPLWSITNTAKGVPQKANLYWNPAILLPDGASSSIQLKAKDTEGKTDGPDTVTLYVVPNNIPTNLGGGPVTIPENTAAPGVNINVTGSDLDPYDKSVLSVQITTTPTMGKLYLAGTQVVQDYWYSSTLRSNIDGQNTVYTLQYVPNQYSFGIDSFSIQFEDQLSALSTIKQVIINVTFSNTPPSSASKTITVNIQQPTPFNIPGPTDPDPNDPTTIHILPPGAQWIGTMTFGSDPNFAIPTSTPYTETGNTPWTFYYTSSVINTTYFNFYCTDTHGGVSPTYTITIITVMNPNDKPPNATNFVVTTYENEAIEFDFAQYITDPNNEMIVSVTIQNNLGGPTLMGPDPSLGGIYDFYSGLQFGTSSANATLLATGSTLRTKFIPLLNAHGTTTFTYNCMDYGRSVSNTATVTVVVIWVDIPPTLTVNGGTTPVSALVSRNSTATFNVVMGDIDSNNVTLLMPKNTIPFGTNGLMCTILLTDPTHGLGAVNIISTTTTLINQLPLPPRSRSFTISWTPSISIPDGQSSGMFFLQAMDSEGKDSTEITVNLATTLNQIPVSYITSPVTLLEDGSTSIILVGTDPDPWHNLVLNFCITQLPLHGTVVLGNLVLTVTCIPVSTTYPNTDTAGTLRNITYTPVQYWSGSDSFSYEFQDLLGATSPVQTVSLSVTHVNHPPVSEGLSLYTPLNTLLPFTLSGSDVDNDQLYFLINADVSKFTGSLGTIKLKTGQSVTTAMNVSASSSGTLDFIYTPPYGLPVTNYPSFTFYIYEFSASGPYTVNVTVGPPTTRDPPVSNSFNESLNQDTSVKIVFDTYVSDPDGIPITVWLLSLPTDGTLSLPSGLTISSVPIQLVASTGSPLYYLNYIPKTEWWGLDQFQYHCIDLFNTTSVPGTVGITVIHIDSPPSITVTPSTQTVQRTFSGIIEVSVVDIDSATINVTLTTENVPSLSVLSFVGDTPIPTPLWYIDNRNVKGIRQYANLSWTPEILLGDGSTGDLVFLATDTEGKTGGPVAVSFAVLKNNPPTNLGGGPVNISENNPGVNIVVTGNDLDPYDKSVLSIMVTSVPTLGTFSLGNTVVQKNTWYKYNLRSNSDGQPTTYTFQYVPTPYVYGSDSFTVVFQDQLGALSPSATVNIVINFVDVPPTSNNVTVTGYIQTQVQIGLPGPVNPENNPVTLHIIPPPVAWQGALTLNSDVSFSINNLTSKYTLTGGSPWIFSYLSNVVVTVSFQFYLTDNKGGSSPNYTATLIITENPAILPPVAEDGYFNVTEGSTCIFDFLSLVLNRDNENIIWVEIMNNVNSTVTVGPDPNLGSLRSANGIPFGSASTSAYLTPVANSATPFLANFVSVSSGFATFTYRVCDASILVSNVATITIDIIHVNFPPVLVIKPTSTLIEPRGDTGVFTITVTDSDSSLVTLYIRNDYDNPLPLEYSTLSFIPSPAGSTVPVTNDTTYTNLTSQYTPFVATISYMPFITMPDSTTGTFVIQACDIHGDCSSEQTGSTGVTPNHPPVVVDLTGSDYNLINTEGEMRIITLTGSDPDSYHTTKLTFIFPSLTKNGPLCLCDLSGNLGQTIQQTDPPFSILGQPDYVHNRTTLVVCYSPLEFYLSVDPITGEDIPDTFRFNVVDLLGASSATKLVSINTNISVPHPPTSINTTLTVNEYDCLVDSCGTPIVNPPFVQIPVTALDATATSNYSLNFIWGTNETIPGQLFYMDSNGNFTDVPLNTPLPRPWKFYYQPSGQTGESPVLILTLPYIIQVDNSYTPEYYLSIFVDPVNKPPVGANVDFTSPMNVPATVNLTHWDPDEPSDSLTLYVVSISFTNQATFASLDGTPISLNKPFNFWNLVATPNLDVYSNPSTTPIAQIQYQIVDPVQLSSDIYTVSYFVTYVYYPIQYAANPNTTMAEDTTVLITLDNNGPGGWFGGNKEYQSVTITLTNFHNDSKPGNYSICNSLSQCTPVSQSNLPVQIPHGSRLRFTPEYNENGQNYSRFDFNVTPAAYPEVPIVEVTWTINVTPINDPPVTIPLNYIPSTALTGYTANRCDENTTFIAAFIATDIDSPLSSLRSVWLTLLDDMPYTFYNCDNVTNLDHSLRNSSCAQGVVMDVDLPEIPRSSIANWKVILVPDLGYYTSFRAVSFAVYTLDNYNAPSIPVKATINVDPINSPPYFVPIGPEGELFAQSNQGNYVLISGIVRDPNFVSGYQVLLTVTTQDGTLGLPLSASKCVLSNNNQTLTCQDLIEKVNLFFNEKSPPGIVFYPPSSEFSLSAIIFFNVNDLGNIDKNKPPHRLSANGTCIVTQIASVTAATAKEGSSSVTSIAVGVGVACAVGIGVAAAFLFKSSKATTDLYLAEFVSNLDSAGNMYNPLYTEATKKAVNPFYSAGGAVTG